MSYSKYRVKLQSSLAHSDKTAATQWLIPQHQNCCCDLVLTHLIVFQTADFVEHGICYAIMMKSKKQCFYPLVALAILFIVLPILEPISPPQRIFGVTT
ncbi:hypothetical protein E2C01_028240 [Portunus trituberculatus]|uniref:Uncharacterized protein n=1 Tax=Portunus trituberculatus TaxID=210409 RepID=A0A5B7ENN2_PORTR|nr:hypothetical protein [Portunus trituberculatus]